MRRTLFFLALCLALEASARNDGGVTLLKNDAKFEYTDPTHALYTHTYTLLFQEGDADGIALFSCTVNNGRTRLKSFSGEIIESSGKPRKLKRTDLSYTEYSEGLADSYGTYFFSPGITSFPATVTYSYEIAYSDAVLSFEPFLPLPFASGVTLKEASYTLSVPSDDCFTFKVLNMPGLEPERTVSNEGVTYVWTVKDLPAGVSEPYSPPTFSSAKAILFTPAKISYEGKAGAGGDWTGIGNWIYSLSEDLPPVPKELADKVAALTEGCESDLEKISRIHGYLGETTRYVSIQLGLGGLRPLAPSFVFSNKFGDCKALSWYMKSMLDCCGVHSEYAVINMGTDRLLPDFPSLATANHAVLCIPLQNDTLWVECTDPEVPLGYVHSGIAGNHALVVRKDASYVTRLPKPQDTDNTDSLIVKVELAPDGNAVASVRQVVHNSLWEGDHALVRESSDKRANLIKSDLSLPLTDLSGLTIEDFPGPKPSAVITYSASASPYASKTGTRLFVPVNPFRNYQDNTSKNRSNDLYFSHGWVDTDVITIRIPEGFRIEAAPDDLVSESEFGRIEFRMETSEGSDEIRLSFSVRHNSGTFSVDGYESYKSFRKDLQKVFGGKIVLARTGSR